MFSCFVCFLTFWPTNKCLSDHFVTLVVRQVVIDMVALIPYSSGGIIFKSKSVKVMKSLIKLRPVNGHFEKFCNLIIMSTAAHLKLVVPQCNWQHWLLYIFFSTVITFCTIMSLIVFAGILASTLFTFHDHACDSEKLKLRCPSGTTINIQWAQYGRQLPSRKMCPHSMTFWPPNSYEEDTNCLAPTSLEVSN